MDVILYSKIQNIENGLSEQVTEYILPYAVATDARVYIVDDYHKFFYSLGYTYTKVAVYPVLKDVEYTIKYFCATGAMDACATAETYFPAPESGYGTGVTYVDKIVATEQGYTTTTIKPTKDGYLYLQIYKTDDAYTCCIRSGKQSKIDIANDKINKLDAVVKSIAYKVESDGIVLATKYDAGHDIQYTIMKHSTNELPDFLHTYIYENTGDVAVHALNNDNRVIYGDGDWHAPYQIKAVNNIDGDSTTSTWFTGGAHGYENDTTGASKTARNAGLKFFADGEEILSGAEGFAERIVMVWTNYIQASNTEKEDGTGREVLKETITMTFMDNVFRSRTEFEPLEDIDFLLWYGLQMIFQSGNNRGIRYIGATNRAEYSPSVSSQCGDSTTNTMMIINKDTNMVQELTINPLVDLGKRQYCANNLVKAMFGESYGKGYATIINSQTSMAEGNIYVLEGEYRTYKKLTV